MFMYVVIITIYSTFYACMFLVIRSSSAKSINKCDPVALYHYYQEQWKKQKFPGQENHSDLRWSVREKMLGGPKVEVCPSASTCRKRCNSWRGWWSRWGSCSNFKWIMSLRSDKCVCYYNKHRTNLRKYFWRLCIKCTNQ